MDETLLRELNENLKKVLGVPKEQNQVNQDEREYRRQRTWAMMDKNKYRRYTKKLKNK
jgi:hypothetical protein